MFYYHTIVTVCMILWSGLMAHIVTYETYNPFNNPTDKFITQIVSVCIISFLLVSSLIILCCYRSSGGGSIASLATTRSKDNIFLSYAISFFYVPVITCVCLGIRFVVQYAYSVEVEQHYFIHYGIVFGLYVFLIGILHIITLCKYYAQIHQSNPDSYVNLAYAWETENLITRDGKYIS